MIDLHTHSNCSDGILSPVHLVQKAHESGISHLALTDHDTVSGSAAAATEAVKFGMVFIPGIEISAAYGAGEIHILGLGIDFIHSEMARFSQTLQQNRKNRNLRILEKAVQSGYLQGRPAALLSEHNITGRPHIAKLLIDNGQARDVQDAFRRFLGTDRELYEKRKLPTPDEVFRLIHKCGGISSLAHPNTIIIDNGYSIDELTDCIKQWKKEGLDAIEAFHPNFSPAFSRSIRKIAQTFYMPTTGGSDFHGSAHPAEKQKLGRWHKNKRIPVGIIANLSGRLNLTQ
ncbi:MAG: PHP domain-containing protein [Spirochaetales bacterium]|nr:PHP domain-containing protein [Spirochaetales bacterium]